MFLTVKSENKIIWELNLAIVQHVLRDTEMRGRKSQEEKHSWSFATSPVLGPRHPYFLFSYSTKYLLIFIFKALKLIDSFICLSQWERFFFLLENGKKCSDTDLKLPLTKIPRKILSVLIGKSSSEKRGNMS